MSSYSWWCFFVFSVVPLIRVYTTLVFGEQLVSTTSYELIRTNARLSVWWSRQIIFRS